MTQTHNAPLEGEQHLQLLRIFIAVADTGTVTQAAEQICRTPSAVTRSIIELERWIGVSLFERKPRGMLLNAYGTALLIRARRIREEIELATDEFLHSKTKAISRSKSSIINLLFSGPKLQLLIDLATTRNISSTAAQLNMTPSGARMALARIEHGLGHSLFQRMAQGMVATIDAERLVVHARRIFAELRYLDSDIAAISGNTTGAVVIAALPIARTYLFPTAIATVISRHPGLWVTSVEGPYEQLIGNLRSGDIDAVFGILRSKDESQGLITEPLFTDQLGILVRAGHPLIRRKRLQLSDLLTEKWVLPGAKTPGRMVLNAAFQKLGLDPPRSSVETGDSITIRQLLYASDMLAVTYQHQLMFEIDSGALVELPVVLKGSAREIGIILRDGAMLSPAALAVVEELRSQVREWQGSNGTLTARDRFAENSSEHAPHH